MTLPELTLLEVIGGVLGLLFGLAGAAVLVIDLLEARGYRLCAPRRRWRGRRRP